MILGERLREAFELLDKKALVAGYIKLLEINYLIICEVFSSLELTNDPEYYNLLFELSELCLSKCFEILPKIMYRNDFSLPCVTITSRNDLPDTSGKFSQIGIPLSQISKKIVEFDYNIQVLIKSIALGSNDLLNIPGSLDDLSRVLCDIHLFRSLVHRRISLGKEINRLAQDILESHDAYKLVETLYILDSRVQSTQSNIIIEDWSEYLKGFAFNLSESNTSLEFLSEFTLIAFKKENSNLSSCLLNGLCRSKPFRYYLMKNSNKSPTLKFLRLQFNAIESGESHLSPATSLKIASPRTKFEDSTCSEVSKSSAIYHENLEHLLLNLSYEIQTPLEKFVASKDSLSFPTPYLDENHMPLQSDYYSYEVLNKSIAP